ncbi:MAG: HPr family phosphocarrier protein [Clostridia bacterium]|nr:HPr family phosphocarrier protein [Clostridia bacterium]
MRTVKIKLSMTENIKDFVRTTTSYPYDIDLRSGRYLIDGKSILGIFSLDFNETIYLDIHSDDCDDFIEEIKQFIVD